MWKKKTEQREMIVQRCTYPLCVGPVVAIWRRLLDGLDKSLEFRGWKRRIVTLFLSRVSLLGINHWRREGGCVLLVFISEE